MLTKKDIVISLKTEITITQLESTDTSNTVKKVKRLEKAIENLKWVSDNTQFDLDLNFTGYVNIGCLHECLIYGSISKKNVVKPSDNKKGDIWVGNHFLEVKTALSPNSLPNVYNNADEVYFITLDGVFLIKKDVMKWLHDNAESNSYYLKKETNRKTGKVTFRMKPTCSELGRHLKKYD